MFQQGLLSRWSRLVGLTAVLLLAGLCGSASAATSADAGTADNMLIVYFFWGIAFIGSVIALVQAYLFFKTMMGADPGTERMQEIAGYVREGANAYLWQQYKVVVIFFAVFFALLAWVSFGLEALSRWVPFAFFTGGFFSALAGWCGMKTATFASNRTAAGAQQSLNAGLQVAFRSGAVMGLTVVGLGLFPIMVWFAVLYWLVPALGYEPLTLVNITVIMLCFGMGASCQALFARVGGGIFTKAADVGADLVGKVEQGIPEDDPRNPATIADNVGDNVGDVAGMGADLYESYCGSILAASVLGVAAYSILPLVPAGMSPIQAQLQALLLPMAIAGVGIFLSIMGIYTVRTSEEATQGNLLAALGRGINSSAALVAVLAIVLAYFLMPGTDGTLVFGLIPGVAFSVIVGLLAGWLIGKWTEYSTSDEYSPTKKLADQTLTGPGTVIIGGIADGMFSVWFPVLVVCGGMVSAFGFASGWNFADVNYFTLGLYGIGIGAVGMLSTLGITLATDAYGPIADNAGGNAEMAHLDPIVRQRTDALDSLGNTTAATGKGFAIGSAALTALALLAAYVEQVRLGFDQWGNSLVASQLADQPDGFYRASEGFLVEKRPDGSYDTYLAMPVDLRHPKIEPGWNTLDYRTAPARVPDGMLRTDTSDGIPVFDATGAPLVPVKTAPLPSFTQYYDSSVMNPKVLVGVFLGAMAVFLFSAMTMKAVGRAAKGMVEEVRRQFKEKPGILEGTERPDYASPVAISTKAAQREMIIPSILGLALPVLTGLVLGVSGVLGLLVGTLTAGFCMAIYMANSGGAWDNAKKYIERGAHGGKGTDSHKAAVVGDTVGDPFKDTSGPSLNILIKLMMMVSVVAAGVVVRFSLVAMGIF